MATKPRVPQVLNFICESCQGHYSADYVREHKGNCGHCQGESWTLKIGFTRCQQRVRPAYLFLEIAARLIFGNEDWESGASADEVQQYEFVFPGVTAADALTICQVPYREQYRVLEYIKYRQQLEADEQQQISEQSGDNGTK